MNQKFETLKNQLGTGLICRLTDQRVVEDVKLCGIYSDYNVALFHTAKFEHDYDSVKPHLFPLKDLTTPIRVEGYNDGHEFFPAVEIYNIFIKMGAHTEEDGNDYVYNVEYVLNEDIFNCPFEWIQLIIRWHFNVFDLPESDYINAAESKVYEPKSE